MNRVYEEMLQGQISQLFLVVYHSDINDMRLTGYLGYAGPVKYLFTAAASQLAKDKRNKAFLQEKWCGDEEYIFSSW
ncbi:hypothetical protein [Desulfocicer niacini]